MVPIAFRQWTPAFISPQTAIDQLQNAWTADSKADKTEGFIYFHPDNDDWIEKVKTAAEEKLLNGHMVPLSSSPKTAPRHPQTSTYESLFPIGIKGWVSVSGKADDASKDPSDRIDVELTITPDLVIDQVKLGSVPSSNPDQGGTSDPQTSATSMSSGWQWGHHPLIPEGDQYWKRFRMCG